MIKRIIITALFLCLPSSVFAAQKLQKLPELVAILHEVHKVDVKDQTEDGVIVSWPVSDGRKLDATSLKILQKVAGITEESEIWYFHVAVFSKLEEGKSSGQVMSESQYKAEKMHNALLKLAHEGSIVEAAGLGHEFDEDRVFLTIKKNGRGAISKIASQ